MFINYGFQVNYIRLEHHPFFEEKDSFFVQEKGGRDYYNCGILFRIFLFYLLV